MERKKKPDGTYRFPFLVTFIGWLIEMLIFGNLGVFQQIPAPTLLSSLALLTAGGWVCSAIRCLATSTFRIRTRSVEHSPCQTKGTEAANNCRSPLFLFNFT